RHRPRVPAPRASGRRARGPLAAHGPAGAQPRAASARGARAGAAACAGRGAAHGGSGLVTARHIRPRSDAFDSSPVSLASRSLPADLVREAARRLELAAWCLAAADCVVLALNWIV